MKTTEFRHSVIEIYVARDDREGLLEARQQIDEALRAFPSESLLLGGHYDLNKFLKSTQTYMQGKRSLSASRAYKVLRGAVAHHWEKSSALTNHPYGISHATRYDEHRQKESAKPEGRSFLAGFYREELNPQGLFDAWASPRFKAPHYATMLWGYLAQFGIFPPD